MRFFGILAVLMSMQSALAGSNPPAANNVHYSFGFNKIANTHSPTGGLILMINTPGAIPSLNQDVILAGRRVFVGSGAISPSAVYSGPVDRNKVAEGWQVFKGMVSDEISRLKSEISGAAK